MTDISSYNLTFLFKFSYALHRVHHLLSFQNRDCVQLGPPDEGDAVQVRWTDGLIYGAKFVASHSIPMYLVNLSFCLTGTDMHRLKGKSKRLIQFVQTTSEDPGLLYSTSKCGWSVWLKVKNVGAR